MATSAIVPARNEAETVATVVRTALASPLVDEVIVVDGWSTDGTRDQAAASGAKVIHPDVAGKGEAMLAGLAETDADVVVFLDGDLTGLRTHHVDRLVRTVATGQAIMACGLFDRGPLRNVVWLHLAPILTGERALRREVIESLDTEDVAGYRVEAALNCRASDLGGPIAAFVCRGMFHATKEKKYPTPLKGRVAKWAMFRTAYSSYVRYRLRHGRPGRRQPVGTSRRVGHHASLTSPLGSRVLQPGAREGTDNGTPDRSVSQRSQGSSPSHHSS